MVMPQHERKMGALDGAYLDQHIPAIAHIFFEDAESNGSGGGRYFIQWKHRSGALLQDLHAELAKEWTVNVPA
jgi:hypothetical protein